MCIVVARQNGKTELLVPLILMALRSGRNVLHTAQNRDLPRQTFLRLARLMAGLDDVESIRKANGQEEIVLTNGARYTLVAPNSNVRGETADLVLIDEVREQHDYEVMDAILPTITARRAPADHLPQQRRRLRERRPQRPAPAHGHRPALAYLEWSAAPDRELDDVEGWAEANPGLGITITMETLEYNLANRPPASFETEHLCRWVITMQPRLVTESAWLGARGELEPPSGRRWPSAWTRRARAPRPPSPGGRATGAWRCASSPRSTGDPIDTARLGPDLHDLALRAGVTQRRL